MGMTPSAIACRSGRLLGLGLLGRDLGGPPAGAAMARGAGQDAGPVEEPGDAVADLRPLAQPVADTLLVEHDPVGVLGREQRVVAAQPLEEAAVARAARVGGHDPVEGPLLGAAARKTNSNRHDVSRAPG